MPKFTTSLYSALKRAQSEVLHIIAKEGVVVLNNVLQKAGFTQSKYLDNYEVYSHVIGSYVLFEIVIDLSAIEPGDEMTKKALEEQSEALQAVESTYGVKSGKAYAYTRDVRRPARDARKPATDARQPARDARKTSRERLIGHEIALHAPRSARMTKQGKLSVILKRSVRETEKGITLPDGKFEGIMKDVMEDLMSVILKEFMPKLEQIISDRLN